MNVTPHGVGISATAGTDQRSRSRAPVPNVFNTEILPGSVDPPDRTSRRSIKATYDRIGSHFAETRTHPWPAVESFLAERSHSTVGLDCGCGNGRHLPLLADRVDRTLAVDVSSSLLNEAIGKVGVPFDPVLAEASALPLGDNSVDTAIYIATLHHLPTKTDRIASITEFARVLTPGGRGLLSAWSVTHDRFDADTGHDRTVEWTLPDGETVDRFYHVYDPDEFEHDVRASEARTVETFTESGNCYAIVGGAEG
jgi:ubiquinone/menaquinone biosynthesis C-methylase UbiE